MEPPGGVSAHDEMFARSLGAHASRVAFSLEVGLLEVGLSKSGLPRRSCASSKSRVRILGAIAGGGTAAPRPSAMTRRTLGSSLARISLARISALRICTASSNGSSREKTCTYASVLTADRSLRGRSGGARRAPRGTHSRRAATRCWVSSGSPFASRAAHSAGDSEFSAVRKRHSDDLSRKSRSVISGAPCIKP